MNESKLIQAFPAGTVRIPPSKSLSHRALICAGLAALQSSGESCLRQIGNSEDIEATMSCMKQLGINYSIQSDGTILVQPDPAAAKAAVMDCRESGSTLRFLLPLAAIDGTRRTLTGQGRLMERPMEIYETIFARKDLYYQREGSTLTVQGPLLSGDYHLPGNVSSQFISGLLFALPLLQGDSRIILTTPLESAAYVDLTLDTMKSFGITIEQPDACTYRIPGSQCYQPQYYTVEGDYSQAAFFLAAGALGQSVKCDGMHPESIQGDAAIIDILKRMGAEVFWQGGYLQALPSQLRGIDIDVREIPDLVPPLAVLLSLAEGTSHIVNAGRLRIKESDRLSAMTSELRKLGALVEEGENSMTITGRPSLDGGQTDAHGDHRIAMAMAVAAIRCEAPVSLSGWQHVSKSYPGFWEDFEKEAANE